MFTVKILIIARAFIRGYSLITVGKTSEIFKIRGCAFFKVWAFIRIFMVYDHPSYLELLTGSSRIYLKTAQICLGISTV